MSTYRGEMIPFMRAQLVQQYKGDLENEFSFQSGKIFRFHGNFPGSM